MTPQSRSRRIELVSVAVAVAAVTASLLVDPVGAADPNDPRTQPIPSLQDTGEKTLAVEVTFDGRDTVTVGDTYVTEGPSQRHVGDPPLLRLELFDGSETMLNSYKDWHPMWVFAEGPDGHEQLQIDPNASGAMMLPFEPAASSLRIRDLATNQVVTVVDLEPAVAEWCTAHPDDPDCAVDLAVAMTDQPDPVAAGETLTYRITVDNQATQPAHDVQLVDTLPDDFTYDTDDSGCILTGTQLSCDLGRLEPDASHTVTVSGTVPTDLVHTNGGPATLTNTAQVVSRAGTDTDPTDNTAVEQTTVVAVADLSTDSVTVQSSPDEVLVGDTGTVQVSATVANGGPSSPMDAVVSWTTSASDGLAMAPATATDSVDALTTGSPQQLARSFTFTCDAPGIQTGTVTATVAPQQAADTDPDATNNTRSATFTVDCLIPVTINIKPAEDPNAINAKARVGVVTVAVLTTDAGEYGTPVAFDAPRIDVSTVRLGTREAVDADRGARHHDVDPGHVEDSYELDNTTRDGDNDLVLHVEPPSDTELERSDTQACLRGEYIAPTGARYRFVGCDSVQVVR